MLPLFRVKRIFACRRPSCLKLPLLIHLQDILHTTLLAAGASAAAEKCPWCTGVRALLFLDLPAGTGICTYINVTAGRLFNLMLLCVNCCAHLCKLLGCMCLSIAKLLVLPDIRSYQAPASCQDTDFNWCKSGKNRKRCVVL